MNTQLTPHREEKIRLEKQKQKGEKGMKRELISLDSGKLGRSQSSNPKRKFAQKEGGKKKIEKNRLFGTQGPRKKGG